MYAMQANCTRHCWWCGVLVGAGCVAGFAAAPAVLPDAVPCDELATHPAPQVPIIAPVRQRKLEVLERAPLPTHYSNEFLAGLMTNPELVRNVAIVGHLHHGKTLVRARARAAAPLVSQRRSPASLSSLRSALCLGTVARSAAFASPLRVARGGRAREEGGPKTLAVP